MCTPLEQIQSRLGAEYILCDKKGEDEKLLIDFAEALNHDLYRASLYTRNSMKSLLNEV